MRETTPASTGGMLICSWTGAPVQRRR